MFQPSQHDVRRFFCETYRKQRDGTPLTPMETLAGGWIAEHPEYHADLADLDAALAAEREADETRRRAQRGGWDGHAAEPDA